MKVLNLASIVPYTESEGPGKRFALWVQGCLKRCTGCCNPHMFEIAPRHIVTCDMVFEQILQVNDTNSLDGVTFLGGEPMLQAKGLSYLARQCSEEGFSVMVFTGYTLHELRQIHLPGVDELIHFTDLLISGPYVRDCPDTVRNWVGSRNQRLHFLTPRYMPGVEYDPAFSQRVEFRIGQNGQLQMNGEPIIINLK